jgi:hypothetical protein
MAYSIAENALLGQAFADTSTKKIYELGTIFRGKDPTYGGGEFIYLLGVTGTIVGSVVVWDDPTHQTTLAPVGSTLPRPVAFAMSANVGSQYGWYQINGMATAAKATGTTFANGAAVGVAATGLVAGSAAGQEIVGALAAAAATNGPTTVLLHVDRPRMQGRIT